MKNKDNNIFIDVDETLIRDCVNDETPDITIILNNESFPKKINHELINKIKKDSEKKYIIVWTSNSFGEIWAKTVIAELQIEKYIDLTLFKPTEIIDDSPIHDWFINFKKPNIF